VGWKRALAGAAVFGVVGALLVAFHPSVRDRFVSSFEFSQNRDRMAIWEVCSEMAAEHPLAGVGFGNLPVAAREKFDSHPITGPRHEKSKRRCHNTFFTSLVEGGPLLLTASIFLFAGPAWGFFRLRRRTDRIGRAACAGVLATLAGMLVNSFVHDPLYASEAGFAFCFALAIATAIATPGRGDEGVEQT
ncbi:MAG TPA: O-antigen ligase family protein, partial [Vulgatibacter sp.]